MCHATTRIPQPRSPMVAIMVIVTGVVFGSAAADEKQPPKALGENKKVQAGVEHAKRDKVYPVTYDVSDLVRNPTPWHTLPGPTPWGSFSQPMDSSSSAGPGPIKDIVETIFAGLGPEIWRYGSEKDNSLKIINGTKLEILANADIHSQIVELLTALRRLADCAVTIEAQLFEIDRDFFQKQIEPKLKNEQGLGKLGASLIEDSLANQLSKQAVLVASNKTLIPHGKESDFLSLHRAFSHLAIPKSAKNKPPNAFGIGFYGISFRGKMVVSSDRMRIRMGITQQSTNLRGISKKQAIDPETGEECKIDVPNLEGSSTLSTIEIEDGKFVIQPVHFQFPSAKTKERMLVMLMKPVIYIQEEENYRKKLKH